MSTLHIEHGITELDTWLRAFNSFEPARRAAGVVEERIAQPVDDPHYVVVDLEFESSTAAARFRDFLVERVWSSPEASPALVGRPRSVILHSVLVSRRDEAASAP
jgi:hypothetical protein